MIKFLLELFVLYIVYKFVFELVLPVYQATKQIKKKMNNASQQMNQQQSNTYTNNNSSASTPNKNKSDIGGGDYIEFEEVK
jgi:competence protein ComGC